MLSNLPFYLNLLPLFLEASVARVEVRTGILAGRAVGPWCRNSRGSTRARCPARLTGRTGPDAVIAHAAATSPAAAPATQVRGESAAQDLVAVLGVLEGAPDLRDLLQRVEREFNKYAGEWWQP